MMVLKEDSSAFIKSFTRLYLNSKSMYCIYGVRFYVGYNVTILEILGQPYKNRAEDKSGTLIFVTWYILSADLVSPHSGHI